MGIDPGWSEFSALPGRGNVELLAVLRHRPTGDIDTFFFQPEGYLLVVEWIALVFGIGDFLDARFHAIPTHAFAVFGFGSTGEEVSQREDATCIGTSA